jgi:tetratricopeptide (TPR) repeat protein
MGFLLDPRQKKQVWERHTNSAEAWEYYLRGERAAWRHSGFGEGALRSGLELYTKAVEIDPEFALATALMSRMYSRLYFFEFETSDSVRDLAWELAERATLLQSELLQCGVARAEYYYRCLKDYDKALKAWEEAVPDNRENHLFYLYQTHHVLRRAGDFEEAYRRLKRAIKLDPSDTFKKFDLFSTCMAMRRHDEALELINEVILKEPDFPEGYFGKAQLALYVDADVGTARAVVAQSEGKVDATIWEPIAGRFKVLEGDFESALEDAPHLEEDSAFYYRYLAEIYDYMGDFVSMLAYADSALSGTEANALSNPDDLDAQLALGLLYARLGREAQALEVARRAASIETVEDDALMGWMGIQAEIVILCRIGNVDQAMEQFEYLMSIPCDFNPKYATIDPDFAALVRHPKFPELLAKGGTVF